MLLVTAGTVDEGVNYPEPGQHLVGGLHQGSLVQDISLDGDGDAARCIDLIGDFLSSLRQDIENRDPGTCFGQAPGKGSAENSAAAGDDHDLAADVEHSSNVL